MSNYKEMPTDTVYTKLYNMNAAYNLEPETLYYQGKIEDAPAVAQIVFTPEYHYKQVTGRNIHITDAIEAPIKSLRFDGFTNPDLMIGVGQTPRSRGYKYSMYGGAKNMTVTFPKPLYALPSGICDIYENGQVTYFTAYRILTPQLSWKVNNVYTSQNILVIEAIIPDAAMDSLDFYVTKTYVPSYDLSVANHICLKNQKVMVALDRTVIRDLDLAKKFLAEAEIEIIYPRKNRIVRPAEHNQWFWTQEGENEIGNIDDALMTITYQISPNGRLFERVSNEEWSEIWREEVS